MPRHASKLFGSRGCLEGTANPRGLIHGAQVRAPLGDLSCPGRSRSEHGQEAGSPAWSASCGAEDRARARASYPRRWREGLVTDYWNPPTSRIQHTRQRVFAVVVAFVLAAVLALAGW